MRNKKKILLIIFFVFIYYGVSLSGPLDNLKIIKQDNSISKKSEVYALFTQGAIYENEGKYNDAKSCYLRALEKDNADYIKIHLIELYLKMGDIDLADNLCKEIVKKNPDNLKANVLKGYISVQKNKVNEAIKYFQKAVDLGEKNVVVYIYLANLYLSVRENEKAEELVDKALSAAPNNPEILQKAGILYLKMLKVDKAFDVLKKLEKIMPDLIGVKFMLADLYQVKGDNLSAIKEYNDILAIDPLNKEVYSKLALIYKAMGKKKEALATYKVLISLDPSNAKYYLDAAQIEIENNNFENAVAILNDALKNNVESAKVYYYLGVIYLTKKMYPQAQETFEKALLLDPKNVQLSIYLSYIYGELKKKDKEREVLENAYEIHPENPELLNTLGYYYAENGIKLKKAYEMIEKALEKKPESGAFLDSMGWVLFKMGKYDEALRYLEKAIKKLPNDATVLKHLGDVYEKLNKKEEALKYWKKSLKFAPDDKNLNEKIKSVEGKKVGKGN